MTEAEAIEWLQRQTGHGTPIALTPEEIEAVLDLHITDPVWQADFNYPTGSLIRGGDSVWRAIFGGWSGLSTPTWTGDEVTDGTIVWEPAGDLNYDLHAAAAEAWDIIAARAAGNYDFGVEGANFDRSQVYAHAVERASHHRARAGAVPGRSGGVRSLVADPPRGRYRYSTGYGERSDPRYR